MIGVLLYIGGLILAGVVGWGIREILSLPGRRAREHKQAELIKAATKAAVIEGIKEYDDWRSKHPGEPMTEPVRQQIANTSASNVLAEMTSSVFLQGGIIGDCKNCGKRDLLNLKGYCRECQQKLPPDGGP
ncbi:MAG: hypothetical protein ABSG25_13760 [Bryobacteraceae bacterium]